MISPGSEAHGPHVKSMVECLDVFRAGTGLGAEKVCLVGQVLDMLNGGKEPASKCIPIGTHA